AVSGLGFLVTLQLQYAWGWSASHAAEGTLPQVAILIVGGAAIRPLISRLGMEKTSWMGAITVVGGLAIYGSLGWIGYEWVATALILVAAGMRVVGVVAGTTVMRGLPADRTTVGAALVDTSGELATGIGIAISGTIIAAWANGPLVSLTPQQTVSLQQGIMQAGIVLTILAAALVSWGITQANRSTLVRRLPA
ncbi:MAG: MFS transporter, partial [Propionibacteriaceae bacterium]|nr:MFS transporter [Propionibacteriaceae bacterium]